MDQVFRYASSLLPHKHHLPRRVNVLSNHRANMRRQVLCRTWFYVLWKRYLPAEYAV